MSPNRRGLAINGEMTAKEAIRTSGFYGLWLMLLLQISSGIAVIATATKLVTKWSGYQLKWTACW